ncbi:L-iditol 2-dehydrogenase [Geosmithia morbida]|uniref:L-arabinitol 4-dehydrogenase n=1 Tax=Geosmithia morbida TaxID=1094350 RepID=A0A9P4YZT7_9HYPO|nr:L-iditol 2-dehydrogenase [Geosmithia morbida]KAF4126083.1 L-iditol 2-dehydrogenase [Geosmithia morbida]
MIDNQVPVVNGHANGLPAPATIKAPLPNPSLQVTADHKLKAVEAPVYAPGPGDVLLHIKSTGICGSDVHFWKAGKIGTLVFEGDCIIGHEAAGVVIRCGEGVTDLRPGDRVAIEPGVPCGECFLCLEGRYNLCQDVQFSGVYPYAGTLQRYKVHPAKWLHKLPDNISFAEGALLEPLSVVLHGINSARLTLGTPVLICGAGPIGLLALAGARASGAHPIVITDIEPSRLEFARKVVPECKTYRVDASKSAEDNAGAIKSLFGETDYVMPRVALECTGVEFSICTAAFTVRRGGVLMVVGVGKSIVNNLPFMHLSLAEIDLRFINRYRDTWPAGIACIDGGLIDVKQLVSHIFPLEKAMDGLILSSDPRNGCIKVQIVDETETIYF